MIYISDNKNRKIRFSDERKIHLEENHPEMNNQLDKIEETLTSPDIIIKSKTDLTVELFYKYYSVTPVSAKYLCVITKFADGDNFIITAYFTDKIKKGKLIWKKK